MSVRLPNESEACLPGARVDLYERSAAIRRTSRKMATSPTFTASLFRKSGRLGDGLAVHAHAVRGSQVLNEQVPAP